MNKIKISLPEMTEIIRFERTDEETFLNLISYSYITNFVGNIESNFYLSEIFKIKFCNYKNNQLNSVRYYLEREFSTQKSKNKTLLKNNSRFNDVIKYIEKKYSLPRDTGENEKNEVYCSLFSNEIIFVDTSERKKIINLVKKIYNERNKEIVNKIVNDFIINFFSLLNQLCINEKKCKNIVIYPFTKYDEIYHRFSFYKIKDLENLEQYKNKAKLIEQYLKNETNFKVFMFIGGWINILYETKDYRVKNTIYFILIESVLTHNPDFNRFNVEDSISKQFENNICTCSSFIGDIKSEKNLNEFRKELRELYRYRCGIVHGDFNGVSKSQESLKSLDFYKNNDEDIEILVNKRLSLIFNNIFYISVNNPLIIKSLKAEKK